MATHGRARLYLAAAGAGTALTLLFTAAAQAVTLNGDWAPFTRCPVDAPSMLAADGVNIADGCLTSDAPSGTIKLGNTATTTGDSNLQVGVLNNSSTGTASPVAPSGGAIVAAPATIPGGLLGLMCPSNIPVISQICAAITNNTLNTVTATIQAAGAPSNLNLFAVGTVGQTVITVPVKIQLSNPFLGGNCYIGSNSHPIVLNLTTQVAATGGGFDAFDPNGTSDPANGVLGQISITGATIGDTTFAVPGATGCGGLLSLIIDPILDLKEGLPSPAGHNSLILNNVTAWIAGYQDPTAFAPNEGQQFSAAWHSAAH